MAQFSPVYVFIHLFTGCFSTEIQLGLLFTSSSQKVTPAEEAGQLLWLQEGPKHNLNTKGKTQFSNNIEEHCGKELPVKQLLWWPVPFQGGQTIK